MSAGSISLQFSVGQTVYMLSPDSVGIISRTVVSIQTNRTVSGTEVRYTLSGGVTVAEDDLTGSADDLKTVLTAAENDRHSARLAEIEESEVTAL